MPLAGSKEKEAKTGLLGGDIYGGPVKRSVTISGHRTSFSLEPIFWAALQKAAADAGLPISTVVSRIDAERTAADTPTGLASAIRCWLLARGESRAQPAD